MAIEDVVVDLSKDPFNPWLNFRCAVEYAHRQQNASAVSFYLRTAEYGDGILTYNSLLRVAQCIDDQAERVTSVTHALLQALSYMPKRPEAYFLMAQFHERAGNWQQAYTWAELGLSMNIDSDPLPDSVGYFPEALSFEKAVSAWWIGRKEESLDLLLKLSEKELPAEYETAVKYNLEKLGFPVGNAAPITPTPFQKYQRNGFTKVEGWVKKTLPAFLESIKDISWNGTGGVCEIGTFRGKFFLQLRSLLPEAADSYGIDIFDDQDLNIDRSGYGSSQELFAQNISNYDPFGGDKVTIIRGDSTTGRSQAEIFSKIPEGSIKYFSIDGGHTMAHVINDMKIAERLVTDAGIVIMDDILHPHWLGVIGGVTEYLRTHPTLVPFAIGYNKLFLCKMSYHSKYIEELKNNPYSQQLVTFMDKELWGVEAISWLN